MALISDAVAQSIVDKVAANEARAVAALEGGFYALATATGDPDVELTLGQELDTLDLAIARGDTFGQMQAGVYNALRKHLAASSEHDSTKPTYQDFDTYLAARNWRVPVEFADLAARQGGSIAKAHVFDSVKTLGTFNVSGAGAGTLTEGVALDSAKTGGNNLEAYVPEGKSATDVALNVTLTKPDGSSETKSITVDVELSAATRVVAIGTAADRYVDVTAVEITGGGAAGEQVVIRSKPDAREES